MVTLREVETRLARIGFTNKFWGRPEVRELQHILVSGEELVCAVMGKYEHGFALLVATDRRLLLVDKKPLFLSIEDLRYDMISEVDYFGHMLDATVCIQTINKELRFTSFRQRKLRELTTFLQHKVMELRQQSVNAGGQPFSTFAPSPQPLSPLIPGQPPAAVSAGYPAGAQGQAHLPVQPQTMATTDPTVFYQRARSPFPGVPLTVRKRVSRLYHKPETYRGRY